MGILKKVGSYLFNILLALDQLGNVIFLNGSPDHTISGRVGYMSYSTGKWYWKLLEKIINTLFFFDDNHCYNSIEWDEINK